MVEVESRSFFFGFGTELENGSPSFSRWSIPTRAVDQSHRAVPDRVERQFQANAPDRLWVADVPYVPTWTGFVCLAIVLDVFSRRIVGWSMAHHLHTELVLGALNMALGQTPPPGGLTHTLTDRGVVPLTCRPPGGNWLRFRPRPTS